MFFISVKEINRLISKRMSNIYLKGHTRKAGLWTHGLDVWSLYAWTLGLWMTGRLTSGRLDSERRDTWTLDAWIQEILSIFSDIYFFLLII